MVSPYVFEFGQSWVRFVFCFAPAEVASWVRYGVLDEYSAMPIQIATLQS